MHNFQAPPIYSGQAHSAEAEAHLGGRGGGEGDLVVVGAAVVVVGAAVEVVGVAVVVGAGVGGGGLQAKTGFSTTSHIMLLL